MAGIERNIKVYSVQLQCSVAVFSCGEQLDLDNERHATLNLEL